MPTARLRLAAFVAALPLLFGGAALAGAAIEPHGEDPTAGATQQEDHMSTAHTPDPVRGLAVAEDGLRLVVDEPELRRGRTETPALPHRRRARRAPSATSTSSTRSACT